MLKVYDLSEFNPKNRLKKLADRDAEGFILKLGETVFQEPTLDENFLDYIEEMKKNGLPLGIYYVSHAQDMNMFHEEANFINDMLYQHITSNGLNLELGIWWDMEVPAVKREGVCDQLLDTIGMMQSWYAEPLKNRIGIYSGYSYFYDYMDLDSLLYYQIPIWVAQYEYPENSLKEEEPELNHVAWQYTTNDETQDENDFYGFKEEREES